MNSDETKTRIPGSDAPYDPPGWVHYIWLIYTGFLFTPVLSDPQTWGWLWPTLASLPVFLILYVQVMRTYRRSDPPRSRALPQVLTIALLGYALLPVNDSANTYLIYALALAPYAASNFPRLLVLTVLLVAAYALELLVLGFRPLVLGMTALAGVAAAATNYVLLENRRKNVALRRSSEEVQRLARVAERERIGRDLHDLLGHTLSLIAIKSELAAKLLERDRAAAAREVADVTNIAREALKQVRTAVSGIRAAALEGELASARLLLETTGVTLKCEHDGALLPAEVETTLAMIVREAVTNIQRHAGARQALIRVTMDDRGTAAIASTAGFGNAGAAGSGVAGRMGAGVAGFGGMSDMGVGAAGSGGTGGMDASGVGAGVTGSGGMGGMSAGGMGPGKAVLLHVSDDGRGGITARGNGLAGIAERVRSLGGTLHIESPRGKGSVLCVRLPLGLAPPVAHLGVVAEGRPDGRAEVARTEVGRSDIGRAEIARTGVVRADAGRVEPRGEAPVGATSTVVPT